MTIKEAQNLVGAINLKHLIWFKIASILHLMFLSLFMSVNRIYSSEIEIFFEVQTKVCKADIIGVYRQNFTISEHSYIPELTKDFIYFVTNKVHFMVNYDLW